MLLVAVLAVPHWYLSDYLTLFFFPTTAPGHFCSTPVWPRKIHNQTEKENLKAIDC